MAITATPSAAKALLTPENHALMLIDHQPPMPSRSGRGAILLISGKVLTDLRQLCVGAARAKFSASAVMAFRKDARP
jgi:hypothetical protein